jgi:uncharacterized membrane protein
MNMETNKNLGGVGALLMFIGVLPLFNGSGILSLIGLILVLVAAKGFADFYRESGIFNNALYAILIAIAGGIVAVAVAITALVSFFDALGLNFASIQDWTALSGIDWQTIGMGTIGPFIGSIVLVLGIVWVFAIIAAFFVRKSLGLLSVKTGVGMFGTVGILMLIGAIIPVLGLVLIWIALLLLAIAFFSIRPQPPAAPAGPTQA